MKLFTFDQTTQIVYLTQCMISKNNQLNWVVSLVLALLLDHKASAEFKSDSLGFYPLWETPGSVLKHRELVIGTSGAAFGINDTAQVGTQPVLFMYRTPNLNGKISLLKREKFAVAIQAGVSHLLPQASRAFFSPMYTSRLDNPDFSVTLVPLSLGSTLFLSDFLQIHQSITALSILGHGVLKNETTSGYSLLAELIANERHSALFHAGKIGFVKNELLYLGTSYRYQNSWSEFRLGYFYRFRSSGMQSAPLASISLIF